MTSRHIFLIILLLAPVLSNATPSVARRWNEALLEAIRTDLSRPTVHARNLFHFSVAIYDAWAAYDRQADTFFLGKEVGGYYCPFDWLAEPEDRQAARREAISYAAYRLLHHRFAQSPGAARALADFSALLRELGYDPDFTATDYTSGPPAALGNYLGARLIEFGLQDGANELNGYANLYYEPVNPPLVAVVPGNPDLMDSNRWQPLTLETFIDQGGNLIPLETPDFLCPFWGRVAPFALSTSDLTRYTRDGRDFIVYRDPGPPAYFGAGNRQGLDDDYLWGFLLVALWSAHLDPADGVLWDISPASRGQATLPDSTADYRRFYDLLEGGDRGRGHSVNPHTGRTYEAQWVRRGDYTRVLAEFWADGPESETPPGHWFVVLNYVSDHPLLEKRIGGRGKILGDLEWDVKTYLALGGAMHDAAVTAWGIKGWYDYIRPISAIRAMAHRGQSSDPELPRFHPGGMLLVPDRVELVASGDSLAGDNDEHIDKIKIYAWRGPDSIFDPRSDVGGVGWILAEKWWPYQRPSFITPPFAGYVSGHSTFSGAAAEVMTRLTGDAYFPGGIGQFHCRRREFLVFEDGPTEDVTLQWATYLDAADQTALSRIWGGIHPPADDIPGRRLGQQLGAEAYRFATKLFVTETIIDSGAVGTSMNVRIYPNPQRHGEPVTITIDKPRTRLALDVFNVLGQRILHRNFHSRRPSYDLVLDTRLLATGVHVVRLSSEGNHSTHRLVILH